MENKCIQLQSDIVKSVQNISEFKKDNNEFYCSQLNILTTSNKKYKQIHNTSLYQTDIKVIDEFQSSQTLDDINEKLSTTHNSPTCEIFTKLDMKVSEYNITIQNEIKKESNLDEINDSFCLDVECCRDHGSAFCCEDFESRIFQWVENNVPKMVKPEEKMEIFFEQKRNSLFRSLPISLKQVEVQSDAQSLDSSMINSESSNTPQSVRNGPFTNRFTSFLSAFSDNQSSVSVKSFEGAEKYGSSLFSRRQSQATSSVQNIQNISKRLSIMTISHQSSKNEDKN